MVKRFLLFLLILPALTPAFSEGSLSMELGLNNIIVQTRESILNDATLQLEAGEQYWGWMNSGSAALSYKSGGSSNVKADLALSFLLPEQTLTVGGASVQMPLLMLDRAYVKARFPWFRITAGKTRLSWGDGFVFNSADVLFGSTDTGIDLTAAEVRTETDWLTAVNIPLGRFSFLEGVIMAPEADHSTELYAGSLAGISGGGRFYTKLADIKIEGGYFFDQKGNDVDAADSFLHKPFLAFQGNLFADWYLASSLSLPAGDDLEEPAEESFSLSGGLFYLHQINSISSISFRMEGLYRPFLSWEEQDYEAGDETPTYALLLYPDISYSPSDTVNLSARSVWSPVDMSAMISFGAGWNIFEGFDLSCYGVINAGDGNDLFSFERDTDLWNPQSDVIDSAAVIIGINYIY